MIEFIYKNLRHAKYRLKDKEYKKMSHAILNNDINSKEKTASSKLVGVKWCNIHKEWYMKAWLSQWELIQSNLIKHLEEIHMLWHSKRSPGVSFCFKQRRNQLNKTRAILKPTQKVIWKLIVSNLLSSVHVTINKNCRSIRICVQPVHAVDGAFSFACLYFLTRMRWELGNWTQWSLDQKRNNIIDLSIMLWFGLTYSQCFFRSRVYNVLKVACGNLIPIK